MGFLHCLEYAPKEVVLDLRRNVGRQRLKAITEVYLMANISYEEKDKFHIYRTVSGIACLQEYKSESFNAKHEFPYVVSAVYHQEDKISYMESLFYQMLDSRNDVDSAFLEKLSNIAYRMIMDRAFFDCEKLLYDLLSWSDATRTKWEMLFARNI